MVAVTRIEQVSQEPESCIIAFILNGNVFEQHEEIESSSPAWQASIITTILMLRLSGRGDSNARPPRPERGALPTALLPVIWWQCGVRTHVNWCHKPAPEPLGQLSRGPGRIRTTNAMPFKHPLYHWSYRSIIVARVRVERTLS